MAIPVNEIIKFTNEYSRLVLEIEGGATTEGTRAEQYTDTGKDHQRWRLKPAGPGSEGFYNIENVHSGMSLEVVGYSKDPGAEIVQRPYADGPLHRQWKLAPVAGKTDVYKIVNQNSGLVLDDVGGRKDAPAPVKQYGSWNDDGRQQWKLTRVATSTSGTPATITPATTTPATTRVPIYQLHIQEADGLKFFYTKNPNQQADPGWVWDGIAFYAFAQQVPGAVPIYWSETDGRRNNFSTNPNPGQGWIMRGIVFYGAAQQMSGAVPVYVSQANKWRFRYSTRPSVEPGWTQEGVAFYAFA